MVARAYKPTQQAPPEERDAAYPLIEKWAREICAYGDDATAHLNAFLLVLDEIGKASYNRDHGRVQSIVWAAQKAAFGDSDQADEARKEFIEQLREKNKLRIVRAKT